MLQILFIPRSLAQWWPQAAIAAGLCAAAFASGGFYPATFGGIAIGLWLIVGVTALFTPAGATDTPSTPALLVIALAAGFVGWTAVSLSWVSDRGAGYEDVIRALLYLGGFLVLVLWGRGRERRWLEGVLVGGGVVVVVALVARLTGFDDGGLTEQLPASGGRLTFPLGYWNALGLLAAIVATLAVWVAGSGSDLRARFGVALIPACAIVIALTDSRGAMIAAIAGAAVAAGFATRRRDAVAGLIAALLTSVPGLIGLVVAEGVRSGEAGQLGFAGLLIAALTIAAALVAAAFYPSLAARLPDPSWRPTRAQVGGFAAIVLGVAILLGPGVLAGSIGGDGAPADPEAGAAGSSLVSGSGRSEFWSVAIDGFIDNPVRGLGAGGYQNWWNATGTLPVAIQNAHSAPLETLAELGLPGFSLLVALGLVVAGTAIRRLRISATDERAALGAAFAVVIVVAISSSIDWIYEMPAVFGAGIVASAAICCGAREAEAGSPATVAEAARLPWRYALVPLVLAAAIASGALAVGSDQLDRANAAINRGDLVEAAGEARAASRFLPWSSEPDLVLAQIEDVAGNNDAAIRSAEEAARKNPSDYRSWLVLATIRARTNDSAVALAYGQRVVELAGEVLPRAILESGGRLRRPAG